MGYAPSSADPIRFSFKFFLFLAQLAFRIEGLQWSNPLGTLTFDLRVGVGGVADGLGTGKCLPVLSRSGP